MDILIYKHVTMIPSTATLSCLQHRFVYPLSAGLLLRGVHCFVP